MRWIAVLALLLVCVGASRAAGPDDQYLDIYNEILQADTLQQSGHSTDAAAKYLEAQTALRKLKEQNPLWNTAIVSFRLDYLADQLKALAKTVASAPVRAPAPAPKAAAPAEPSLEVAGLQEQIRSLTAVNAQLENKLKEALSVQPAAVSPQELAKAQEQIVLLQKQNDLLSISLDQARSKTSKTPAPAPAKSDNTASQLAQANQALADLKMRSSQEMEAAKAEMARLKDSLAEAQKAARTPVPADAGAIAAERDKLKEELAARTRDLADAEAHRDASAAELRGQLAEAQRQVDELKAKLAAVPAATPASTDAQVDQLRARVAILEAQAAPYTSEELAVMQNKSSPTPGQIPLPAAAPMTATTPASPAEHKRIVHSMKDLPPGAGALMIEATRDAMSRDYPKAEEKYQEILRQDEDNVYVLDHLANAQYALGQLGDCEKTVKHSLALDPDDPAGLFVMGVLCASQNKLDEALNDLSLSAKYSPTNAGTQFYLGDVLAQKGLRTQAETAFRKALQFDPNYGDAHYGLACVYASEKPPSLELARWHYHRALDLGHGKNKALEAMLSASP